MKKLAISLLLALVTIVAAGCGTETEQTGLKIGIRGSESRT